MYIFGKNRRKIFIIKYCICHYVDAHSQPPPENIMNESGAHSPLDFLYMLFLLLRICAV